MLFPPLTPTAGCPFAGNSIPPFFEAILEPLVPPSPATVAGGSCSTPAASGVNFRQQDGFAAGLPIGGAGILPGEDALSGLSATQAEKRLLEVGWHFVLANAF
eukprot:6184523-Pleurochrysis_carterae.AAC.1